MAERAGSRRMIMAGGEPWEAWEDDRYGPYGKQNLWTNEVVRIRRNSDGAEVEFTSTGIVDENYGLATSIWEVGNFSCDCNRRLFFERDGLGHDDPEDNECGDGAYSVRISNPITGRVVYAEY